MNQLEKKDLHDSLITESDAMGLEFAGLNGRALTSLQTSNKVTPDGLINFIDHLPGLKLANPIQMSDTIPVAISKLRQGDVWNFYDYNVLRVMIDNFCDSECSDRYDLRFKKFCQRRVSEVRGGEASVSTKKFVFIMDDRFKVLDSAITRVRDNIQKVLQLKPIEFAYELCDGYNH